MPSILVAQVFLAHHEGKQMDNENVRREIEQINLLGDYDDRVNKTMKVIEREVQLASDRSYYSAMFESTGPIGCSMD